MTVFAFRSLCGSALRAAALSVLCAPALAAAPAATDWADVARRDLQFAADAIATRHAGAVDGQPSVTVPLADGLRLARADLANVRSEQDYLRLMSRFIAGFGDPHTSINLRLSTRGWTGIVLDQVDGRYRVVWSEPGWPNALPPAGSIARTCDGVYTGTFLEMKLRPYLARSPEYPDSFSSLAQQAMFDQGLGWTPAHCVFALPDGALRRYDLPLRAVPGQVSQERLAAVRPNYRAAAKPVGVTQFGAGRYWVGMPDFHGARSGPAYEALYPKLSALKQPAWVVFDLRGNGGGDSSWGTRALSALYGEAYLDQLGSAMRMQKYLIADAATVTLFEEFVASPAHAHSRDYMRAALAKVRAAISAGQKMAATADDGAPAGANELLPARSAPRPHGPRLAALIDRGCFSSCMSFLLAIRATGDAVVLGEPTIGFSPFGEITKTDLPSGRGALYIPSALYRADQATREPFVPDHAYPGRMSDEAALTEWVGRTLDAVPVR